MAIAYDASSSVYNSSASTSHTLSHTCTGSNRVLVVGTRTYDANAITGVTYNGVSMTEVGSNVALGSDAFRRWILVNPASGANDIVASLSSSRRIEIYAVSFTGAKQSAQPDASATATGSSTSATGSVTTVADNSWVVAFAESNGASGAWSSSTNCTVVQSITDRGAAGYGGPKTPAGSFTQAIAIASTGGWGFAQVSIAPAPGTDFSVSDTATATETVTSTRARSFTVTDTLSIVESVTAALGRIFSVADTATVTDVATALRTRIFSALDALAVSEPVVTVRKLWERVTRDSTSFSKPSRDSSSWSRPNNPNTP